MSSILKLPKRNVLSLVIRMDKFRGNISTSSIGTVLYVRGKFRDFWSSGDSNSQYEKDHAQLQNYESWELI